MNPGFSDRESRAIRPRRRRRKDNQETFTFTSVNCPSFRMLPHPAPPPHRPAAGIRSLRTTSPKITQDTQNPHEKQRKIS